MTLGIRPHDIRPTGPGQGERPDIRARVHLTEPLGDVVILDIDASGVSMKMVLPEEQAIQYAVGSELNIAFDVENTHLFAAETGTAIR